MVRLSEVVKAGLVLNNVAACPSEHEQRSEVSVNRRMVRCLERSHGREWCQTGLKQRLIERARNAVFAVSTEGLTDQRGWEVGENATGLCGISPCACVISNRALFKRRALVRWLAAPIDRSL